MRPVKDHIQRHGRKWTGAAVGLCASFLMVREGYEPVAKHERADPAGVITWCYGRTNYDDPTVPVGERFSKEDCKQELIQDLINRYGPPVQACIPQFVSYGPHRQAALVSAAYNLGAGRICNSGVGKNLRAGNVEAGCDALLAYTRANGVVLAGLVKRRRAEYEMCRRED
jgi:lysozyme